jgi:hypothetical protein
MPLPAMITSLLGRVAKIRGVRVGTTEASPRTRMAKPDRLPTSDQAHASGDRSATGCVAESLIDCRHSGNGMVTRRTIVLDRRRGYMAARALLQCDRKEEATPMRNRGLGLVERVACSDQAATRHGVANLLQCTPVVRKNLFVTVGDFGSHNSI